MPKRSRKAVLIVEDDPKRRANLYQALQLARVDVISASNGEKAMELVRREHPNLILLNMFSQEAAGIDFLKELRCYGLGRQIVVLGMVGDEDENLWAMASEAEPDKLLERDPPKHLILELVLGYLKIEKIEIPAKMQTEVGQAQVQAASSSVLQKEDVAPKGVLQITKSTTLLLTPDAGRKDTP